MDAPAHIPAETVRHVATTCLCLHVQRAARSLARAFDTALRPLELSSGQFSLLMALNRKEPQPVGKLALFLAMDRTSVTAALKPLERRGLVAIHTGRLDRRNRIVSITEAGIALLRQAVPVWQATHAQLDAGLAQGVPERLRADLGAVGAAIARLADRSS